jgi:hypothetical protein
MAAARQRIEVFKILHELLREIPYYIADLRARFGSF